MHLTVRHTSLSWRVARGCREAWKRRHMRWVITGVRNAHKAGLQSECTEDFCAAREEGHDTLWYGHTFPPGSSRAGEERHATWAEVCYNAGHDGHREPPKASAL